MSSTQSLHPVLRGPVPLGHLLLRRFIQPGNRVVDATCGNGKDTLLLAELVGEAGHVYAFDVQPEALARTAERLAEQGLQQRATLLQVGHEQLLDSVNSQVQAVVFNLGWLPGASREITTRTDTTLIALQAALQLLAPAGLLLIICYPGHAGGDQEAAAVVAWCSGLSPRSYFVWRMGQLNVVDGAPFCLVIQDGRAAGVA